MTRRPPPIPHRIGSPPGRTRHALVQRPDRRACPHEHRVGRHGGGEPHALALFILMLVSIVLAFLAR